MRHKIFLIYLTAIVFIMIRGTVFADETEEWDPSSAGPITTWTAPLCAKGEFVMQPFLFYNRTRGSFNSEGHYDSLANNDRKY
jgi:hypothetical protein